MIYSTTDNGTLRFCVVALTAALLAVASPVYAAEEAPRAPRLFFVPSAWLIGEATVWGMARLTHRADPSIALLLGISDLADLEFSISDRIVRCETCPDVRDTAAVGLWGATLRAGVPEDTWGWWQPALSLGFRKAPGSTVRTSEGTNTLAFAEVFAVLSKRIGAVGLHTGTTAAALRLSPALDLELEARLLPMAGVELGVGATTIVLEVSWTPAVQVPPVRQWVVNGGVRYMVYRWLHTELGVRFRESDRLENAMVFAGATLRWEIVSTVSAGEHR